MLQELEQKLQRPDVNPVDLRREFLALHRQFPAYERSLTKIEESEKLEAVLSSIFQNDKGIILGEEHFDGISAEFLASQMRNLGDFGVKTLFFEGLYHGFEHGIDGKRDISDSVHPHYHRLITEANKNQIRVVGIDHVGAKGAEGVTRDILMNAFASHIINQRQGKWVALVGMMHLRDSIFVDPRSFKKYEVRGLAELTGAVSIVLDADMGRLPYVKKNASVYALPAKKVKADLMLGVQMEKRKSLPSFVHPVEELRYFVKKLGGKLSHYDIDSYARGSIEGGYVKGAVFGLCFKKLSAWHLNELKNRVISAVAINESDPFPYRQWLDVVVNEQEGEVFFCCHAARVDEVTDAIQRTLTRKAVVQ